MKKHNNGFAQTMLLALLPFLVGAGLLVFSLAGITQLNIQVNSGCRKEQIYTQAQIRDLLNKLMALNPRARVLRLQFLAAKAALVAAITSGHPGAIAAAKANLERVHFQRQTLDFSQKALISSANSLLLKSSWKTYRQVQEDTQRHQGLVLWTLQIHALKPQIPLLSVEPELPDIAPPYRPMKRFSERQALEQKWQYSLRIRQPLHRFLPGYAEFEKICSTTLQKEDQEWTVITKEDRSSWKPSWF